MADASDNNEAGTVENDRVNLLIQKAEADPNVPLIYFNGMRVTCNERDVSVVLNRGDQDTIVGVLYASHSVAKTLAAILKSVIEQLETATNQDFLAVGGIDLDALDKSD